MFGERNLVYEIKVGYVFGYRADNAFEHFFIYHSLGKYCGGVRPAFNNKNAGIKEYPTRADDELYTYVFLGWDKELRSVTADVTYTARYKAVLKEYTVTVEPTQNGKVTPDGSNIINSLDRDRKSVV